MSKGLAICIGVNSINPEHYGTNGELYICEKDADDMHNLLMLNGFTSLKLTTKKATRKNVKNAILDASKELKEGDIIVVYYSGHGGKVPNLPSPYDIEYDNIDETWCLWDAQLLDDELRNLWAGFEKGVRIVLLSDSCHSGSIAKAPIDIENLDNEEEEEEGFIRKKAISDKVAKDTFERNEEFYRKLAQEINKSDIMKKPVKAFVKQISGCQDTEYSYTGETNSAFTEALIYVWDEGRFEGTYKDFYLKIREQLFNQHPKLLEFGERIPQFDIEKPFTIEEKKEEKEEEEEHKKQQQEQTNQEENKEKEEENQSIC